MKTEIKTIRVCQNCVMIPHVWRAFCASKTPVQEASKALKCSICHQKKYTALVARD